MSVKMRIAIEQLIAEKIVIVALANKWTVSVFDSEEFTINKSDNLSKISKAMFLSDDDKLIFFSDSGERIGWVQLFYGNSGYDVIHDYSTNLEKSLKDVFTFCDQLRKGKFIIDVKSSKSAWNGR